MALIFKYLVRMSNYFAREDPRSRPEGIRIKEIPHLNAPERISQLNFSRNDIRTIPPHITAAHHLQIIDLSHNKISKIDHLCRIPSLKFVNLSYNLIAEVPNAILNLAEIENVDLAFNKIAILNNIKVLKRLVELRTFDKKGFIEINLEGN
jgi:Leucine-rich repeat (LRR) protein